MRLILSNTNTEFYLKDSSINNYKKLSKAVKTHLKRNKFQLSNILYDSDIEISKCAWCNKENMIFYLLFDLSKIDENIVSLKDIDYNFAGNSKARYICHSSDCESTKLNPNSLEFIKLAYKLSENDAIGYLHSRNCTPFYKENHESDLEYINTQSKYSKTNKLIATAKATFSRSLAGYTTRYGQELGTTKWLETCKNKAITLENYIKNGSTEDEAYALYEEWKLTVSFTKEAFIKRFGPINGPLKYLEEMVKRHQSIFNNICNKQTAITYIGKRIREYRLSLCKNFKLSDKIGKSSLESEIMIKYDISIDDIDNQLIELNYGYKTLDNIKINKFGLMSWTEDGKLLRSSFEYSFYTKMIKAGLTSIPYDIGGWYPCKKLKYDFYLLGTYIEIAGMMSIPSYKDQIAKKINLYNCLVSYNYDDQDAIINKLSNIMNGITT